MQMFVPVAAQYLVQLALVGTSSALCLFARIVQKGLTVIALVKITIRFVLVLETAPVVRIGLSLQIL